MNLTPFFKSIIDQDHAAVVVCDTQHKIIYMNPAADENYIKSGGKKLVGDSLLNCHSPEANQKIIEVLNWFKADKSHNKVHTFYNQKQNKDVYMIALRDENGELIGYYEKHEFRNIDKTPFYIMED